jgi:hypothetical protein
VLGKSDQLSAPGIDVGAGRQKNVLRLSQISRTINCSVSCRRQFIPSGKTVRIDNPLMRMINPIWHAPC